MTTQTTRPRAARLALGLSLATAVAWIAKDVAIVSADGRLGVSPLEGPLFLLGLGLSLAAGATLGVAAAHRSRSAWKRAVGALVAVVAVSLVGVLVQLVVAAVRPADPSWAWAEMNLWAVAATLLVGSLVVHARARRVSEASAGALVGAAWTAGS